MDKILSIQATEGLADTAIAEKGRNVSWKDFIQLTKPGILRSNLFAAFAGFWLASGWHIAILPLLYMLTGTTLVMASSCVFNNYLDRELDERMERTRKRALPAGRVGAVQVLIFGILLGMSGLLILALTVNLLSALLGFIGMFVYVGIYTAWLKRRSTLSTVMGSFSGSMPPVIGYCAVTGHMDIGAWILFALLFLWQPPHFWALGIRRLEEYREAGFQILPVVKGVKRTKYQMVPYITLLVPVSALLYVYGYVGIYYLAVAVAMGVIWLGMALSGFKRGLDVEKWSRRLFLFSINYLMLTFLFMIINTVHG